MKQHQTIPFYGPDGTSLGYRTPEAAERLVANGYVKPAYGRKGHLKAIWLRREDGSSPVEARGRARANAGGSAGRARRRALIERR